MEDGSFAKNFNVGVKDIFVWLMRKEEELVRWGYVIALAIYLFLRNINKNSTSLVFVILS